jgi:hypothetical protein
MALNSTEIKTHAMIVAHQSFFAYFVGRDVVPAKHPLTSLVFPSEAAMRSQIGGLETSLGTGLWQRLANRLAVANKLVVFPPGRVECPSEPSDAADVARSLEANAVEGTALDQASIDIAAVVTAAPRPAGQWRRLKKGDGVDLHFEKGGVEYAVDLKTAHLNAKNGSTFHDMLKRWIIYRHLQAAGKISFRARLVIPYDSEFDGSGGAKDWWAIHSGKAKPLTRGDLWIGREFWEVLTDFTDAWAAIRDGFKCVAPKLKTRYEPLLSKRASVADLKELLESYGVTRLALDPKRGKLMRACDCGKPCALTQAGVSASLESSVNCRSRTKCGRAVLAAQDYDWLK